MGAKMEFEQLNRNRDVAELAIKMRSSFEYCLRVLDEVILSNENVTTQHSYSTIKHELTDESTVIIGKITELRDYLRGEHGEFLGIP